MISLAFVTFTGRRWKLGQLGGTAQVHRDYDLAVCTSDRCLPNVRTRCGNTALRLNKILLWFLVTPPLPVLLTYRPFSKSYTQHFMSAFICLERPLPILWRRNVNLKSGHWENSIGTGTLVAKLRYLRGKMSISTCTNKLRATWICGTLPEPFALLFSVFPFTILQSSD